MSAANGGPKYGSLGRRLNGAPLLPFRSTPQQRLEAALKADDEQRLALLEVLKSMRRAAR